MPAGTPARTASRAKGDAFPSELAAFDMAHLDLADAVRRCVRELQPQIIVNAAAYTTVDKAESELQLARTVNALAPGLLAEGKLPKLQREVEALLTQPRG